MWEPLPAAQAADTSPNACPAAGPFIESPTHPSCHRPAFCAGEQAWAQLCLQSVPPAWVHKPAAYVTGVPSSHIPCALRVPSLGNTTAHLEAGARGSTQGWRPLHPPPPCGTAVSRNHRANVPPSGWELPAGREAAPTAESYLRDNASPALIPSCGHLTPGAQQCLASGWAALSCVSYEHSAPRQDDWLSSHQLTRSSAFLWVQDGRLCALKGQGQTALHSQYGTENPGKRSRQGWGQVPAEGRLCSACNRLPTR